MRRPRARRSTLTAAVTCLTATACLLAAPAANSDPVVAVPSGGVALPVVDSAEDFDANHVLASGDEGMVIERRQPNDWLGNAFPASYELVQPDGSSRALPDLDPGYRRTSLDGGVLTSWSDNPQSVVRRRNVSNGERLQGDGWPMPFATELLAASSAGWITTTSREDGVHLTFVRPDGSAVPYAPEAGVTRRHIGAEGTDAYFFEYASPDADGVVKRLDAVTGAISVVASTGPNVGFGTLTPSRVVWTEWDWDMAAQQAVARLCHVARTGGTKACQSIGDEWRSRIVGATDEVAAWRDYDTQTISVSSLTGSFAPRGVTGLPPSALMPGSVDVFGDGFAIADTRGRIWRFGAAGTAAVLDQAAPRPAEAVGLALAPGRLVGADNRRVLNEGTFGDDVQDNTYAGWSRTLTRGPAGSVAVGTEQPLANDVRRAGWGNAIAASSSRTVRVTRKDRSYPASCTVTVADGERATRTDVSSCEGSVISGPYYSRELAGPPWGYDAVVSVDGRVLQKLAWPTAGTVSLFGSRAAWVGADGAFWYRDVENAGASPRLLRAGECAWAAYANTVSTWGRQVIVAPHCSEHAYLYDVVAGTVRELPAMRVPKLVEGGVVWSAPGSTALMALDLTSPSAAPVRLGDVTPFATDGTRPHLTVDDHLVAWQDHVSGRVIVAPLPFGQSSPHPPRLLGAVVPTALAAAANGRIAPWHAELDVTKPLDTWRLDLRDTRGTVVRTWTGSAPFGAIRIDWDGRLGAGWAPAGPYTWTLTGTAADGEGALRSLDGTSVPLTGRLVVKDARVRDLGSDRLADLLAVDGKGALWRYDGTGSGGFRSRVQIGSGWGGMSFVVSAGDLTGDGRPDLLARDAAGVLWRYDGSGAGGLKPRVKLSVVFRSSTAIVGAGDITGDGKADVLARDAAGQLWRYDGTGSGGLRAGVRIGARWQIFSAIVSPGDITGDGRPDLLVRDKAGVLARYDGTGSGSYRPRVALGTAWKAMPVLAAVGDVDGDGTSDLLARDQAGTLWRYPGTGIGGFGTRAVSGSGWQIYPRVI